MAISVSIPTPVQKPMNAAKRMLHRKSQANLRQQPRNESVHLEFALFMAFVAAAGFPAAFGYLWTQKQKKFSEHIPLQPRWQAYQQTYQPPSLCTTPGFIVGSSSVTIDIIPSEEDNECAIESDSEDDFYDDLDEIDTPVIDVPIPTATLPTPVTPVERDFPILPPRLPALGSLRARRGRLPLRCDTGTTYAIDAVVTSSLPESDCPDITDAPDTDSSSVYGFDEETITPPCGSPLWQQQNFDSIVWEMVTKPAK